MPHHLRKRGKVERVGWGTLNGPRLSRYRKNWDWQNMKGSDACLKWSFRDLENLDFALANHVGQKRTAIQAGGNLGIFPKRLAEEFAKVYAFEPDAKLFACATHNAPEENIFHIEAALGNEHSPVSMSGVRRDNSGRAAHEGLTHVAGPGSIVQMRIDDLGVHDCDLIYLDIEGFEYFALLGAQATIERCRPVIVVEVNGNCEHYGITERTLRKWIRERGYKCRYNLHSDEVYVPL